MTRANGAGWKPQAQAAANYMLSMALKQCMNVFCSQAAPPCSSCNVLPVNLRQLATCLVMHVVPFILMSLLMVYVMDYLFFLYLDYPQILIYLCNGSNDWLPNIIVLSGEIGTHDF